MQSQIQFYGDNFLYAGTNVSQNFEKIRVLKQNLAFISGITPVIANANILKSKQFFGHYGTVKSIKLKKEYYYGDKNKKRASFSAYVSFKSSLSAKLAILSLKDVKINNMVIKSCFGFTKVCKSYLEGQPCLNYKNCQYLHSLQFKKPFISIEEKDKIKKLSKISFQSFIQNLTKKDFQRLMRRAQKSSVQNSFFPDQQIVLRQIFQKLALQKSNLLDIRSPSLQSETKQVQIYGEELSESNLEFNFKKSKKKAKLDIFFTLTSQDILNPNKQNLQNELRSSYQLEDDEQTEFISYDNWNCAQNFFEFQNFKQLDNDQ